MREMIDVKSMEKERRDAWDWREAKKVHYADAKIFRKSVIG